MIPSPEEVKRLWHAGLLTPEELGRLIALALPTEDELLSMALAEAEVLLAEEEAGEAAHQAAIDAEAEQVAVALIDRLVGHDG